MSEAFNRYLEAASGLSKVTKDTAEGIVRSLVEQGQLAARNPQELVESLVERSQENREALLAMVRSESKRAVKRMGLATRNDVERLQRQVADLRRKLREAEQAGEESPVSDEGPAGSSGRPAQETTQNTPRKRAKQAAKKTTAKKATKKAAKRSTAKRAAKSSAKKSTGQGGS